MINKFFNTCFGETGQTVYTNNIDFTSQLNTHLYDDINDIQYDVSTNDIIVHFLTNNQTIDHIDLERFNSAHVLVVHDWTVKYFFNGYRVVACHQEHIEGLICTFIATHQQTTQLEQLVYIDELTQLINRKALFELMQHYLKEQIDFALLVIDCDNFKIINDGNGHIVGDRYLQQIASRLRISKGISCRLGGDEFVIVLPTVTLKQAEDIARNIQASINTPLTIDGVYFPYVGCSIGVALSNKQSTVESLLQQADVAMYVVKQFGGNNVQMFNSELCQKHYRRVEVIKHISQAQHNKEYSLNIQPIYCCDTHEPVGGEMLLRWTDSNHVTDISPMEFIPLLEQTGEIVKVGKWIITESIRMMHHLLHYEIVDPDFWVSINLSAQQLTMDTVEHIKRQLDYYQVNAKNIHLEITESALIDTTDHVRSVLDSLRDMGHKIYLDDFGTGYCSLAYIKRLNIDGIKIDKTFITNFESDTIEHVIINAIIDIAHFLGISVIAEGIEQQETEQNCCSLGCTHLQGMYLSEPVSFDQFITSTDS